MNKQYKKKTSFTIRIMCHNNFCQNDNEFMVLKHITEGITFGKNFKLTRFSRLQTETKHFILQKK